MDPIRVQGLLEEIVSELKVHRAKISKSNPKLVGAFDGLIMRIEAKAKKGELGDKIEKFATVIRILAYCIDIIIKLHNALLYKLYRLQAT